MMNTKAKLAAEKWMKDRPAISKLHFIGADVIYDAYIAGYIEKDCREYCSERLSWRIAIKQQGKAIKRKNKVINRLRNDLALAESHIRVCETLLDKRNKQLENK